MKPLTKQGPEHANEDRNSLFRPLPDTLHSPQAYGVVVLGVMYPSAVPRLWKDTSDGLPHLLKDLAGQQSINVIFYDPLSSLGRGIPHQGGRTRAIEGVLPSPKVRGNRQASRKKELEAVARELALLSWVNERNGLFPS